jgi:sodium/bile acid cotransporter 7
MTRCLRRFQPDGFVIARIGTVAMATLLPCQGMGARIFHGMGVLAIASLFFLQGAWLSRDAVVAGATHWRLHVTIASTTFALFPLLACGSPEYSPAVAVVRRAICLRSASTVQSSIALTSIARGNVAAVCDNAA